MSLFIFLGCSANSDKCSLPDEIEYVGRFKFDGDSVSFGYPGCSIKFQYKGDSVSFGMKDINRSTLKEGNWFNIIVDGEVIDSLEINLAKSWYTIKFDFNDKFHQVELFKRTEAMVGNCMFYGIQINGEGEFRKPQYFTRSIEWIGDSFTAGYGNLVSAEAPPLGNPSTGFHSENENCFYSYSSIVSRKLQCRNENVSVSGIGVYRNYSGDSSRVISDVYGLVFPSSDIDWSPTLHPDLVVLNIGRNDFGREQVQKDLNTDSARFVRGYIELLEAVRNNHPNSKILLLFGGGLTDLFPKGNQKLSRYRRWINTVVAHFSMYASVQIEILEIPILEGPYGEDWHPTVRSHFIMAELVENKVRVMMDWR